MLLRLQGYDMTIVYCLDKEMTLAGEFSRLPNKKTREEINLDIRVDFVQFSMEKLTKIHADPTLCKRCPDTFKEISKNVRPYKLYRDELTIENGIPLKRIPKSVTY